MLAVSGYFGWQYLELRRENKELVRNKEQLTDRYAQQSEKLRESERMLKRLEEDPEYVEMIIRKRLGYAKSGELIYSFQPTFPDNTPLPLIISETNAPSARPPQQPRR